MNEKKFYYSLLIISVFFTPICFLFFYQDAFFNGLGWIDPFFYIGYGQNYSDSSYLTGHYKISRLPWVLVQFAYRSIFNTDIVSYILHFSVYALASYFIFKIAQKIAGNLSAFMIAILTPIFLYTYCGGADYQNNFSAVLFLGLILHIINGTNTNKDTHGNFFLITGILYALVIHTNILLSLDALVYGIAFYSAIKIQRDEKIFDNVSRKLIFTIGGFLLCTLILCLINNSIGRHFSFMKPLWKFMSETNPGRNTDYWIPLKNFIWNSKYLTYFISLFCYSIFLTSYLFFKKLHKKNILIFLLNLAFIFTIFEAFVTQTAGLNNLQMTYFAFIILVPFLLTLSANLGLVLNSNNNPNISIKKIFILAISGAIFLLILMLNKALSIPQSTFLNLTSIWLLFFFITFSLRNKIGFSAAFVFIYFTIAAYTFQNSINYDKNSPVCNPKKSISDAYTEFDNHVKKYKSDFSRNSSGNIFVWANKEQNINYNTNCSQNSTPLTQAAVSITVAFAGSAHRLDDIFANGGMNKINDLWQTKTSLADLKEHFLAYTATPRVLVLISYDDNDVLKMIAKMKHYKINFSLLEKRAILTDAFTLQYYVLKEEV